MRCLILILFSIVCLADTCLATEAEETKDFPELTQYEFEAVYDSEYGSHKSNVEILAPYEIPKEIRSAIKFPLFYASSVVPELHFLWLRYFAALEYDKPQKRELAKAKFQQALELLEKNKQDGTVELWKNAWNDGNPDAYLKLQELFKEQKHWCRILSHFPTSETDMMKKIQEAREALAFYYGSTDDSQKLNLETPHVSIPFARFEEARLINALEKKESVAENSIRHLLQGVYVHYRQQWTQEKIGNQFGVSQSSVSSFLSGKPCPKLADNVRKYYEEHPDFYFFEPRKKRGWSFNLSSFLPWKSAEPKPEPKKEQFEEKLPLIKSHIEKKKD